MRVFESEKSMLSALISGEIDIEFFFNLKYNNVVANIPNLESVFFPNEFLLALFFNLKNPIFRSEKSRQALNYAVDQEFIFNHIGIIDNQSQIATSVVPTSRSYYNKNISPYSYDPQKTLALLLEDGWILDAKSHFLTKNGDIFRFSILMPQGWTMAEKASKMIAEDLAKVGIKVDIRVVSFDDFINQVFIQKNYDTCLFHYINTLGIYGDDLFWKTLDSKSYNFTSYQDAQASTILDQIRFESDPENLLYQKFQKIIHDNPPAIYLFWSRFPLIYNKKVKGISPNPYSVYGNMSQVWIEE